MIENKYNDKRLKEIEKELRKQFLIRRKRLKENESSKN